VFQRDPIARIVEMLILRLSVLGTRAPPVTKQVHSTRV